MSANVSQNGWIAIKSSSDPRLVNFPPVTGKIRKGDIEVIFYWLVAEYEKRVEEIRKDWSWAWSYRNIRGASALSNHAMAGATDHNAPRHPLGVDPTRTMTAAQIRECHKIAAESGGVLRWGGSYAGRKDTMHWEINAGAGAVSRFADKIRAGNVIPVGKVEPGRVVVVYKGINEAETEKVQTYLTSTGDYDGALDGKYGARTAEAVRSYTRRQNKYGGAKFANDGEWGPLTQKWCEWVRDLQDAIALTTSSKRLGKLRADGDYGALTNKHVAAVQKNNAKYYKLAGGGVFDGEAGKVTINMLRAKPFKIMITAFKW